MHHIHDTAEFAERHTGIGCDVRYLAADAFDAFGLIGGKSRPLLVDVGHFGQPIFIELMTHIAIEERLAGNLVPLGQAQHLTTQRRQAAVE